MGARLVPCSRVPRYPRWAVVVALAWCALVVAGYVLSQRAGVSVSTCVFRMVTGLPCPACGGTRVVMRSASGDVAWAVATNPLVFVAVATVLAALLLRVVLARRVDVGPWTPRRRRWATAGFVVAVLANWAYLIVHGT